MLSASELKELVMDQLMPEYQHERGRLDRIDRWYRWNPEDIRLPDKATREHKHLRDMSKAPWLALVVTSTAQCMYVDGYRSALDPITEEKDDPEDFMTKGPYGLWLANHWDSRQIALHRAMLAYGYTYATCLPGEDFRGEKMPLMRGISPRKMVALYEDPAEDDWPQIAMKVTYKRGTVRRVKVYDERYVYNIRLDSSSKPGVEAFALENVETHGAGVVPVVRYCKELDLDGRTKGEVEPYIDLARRINKTSFDRMLIQHYNSWKIRWISGLATPDVEEEANRKVLKLSMMDFLVAEDTETKFGALPETGLSGINASHREDVETLAATSQTPTHELTGQMVNLPLALDTVVPLPDGGRTTMGDVQVGDQVLDPNGSAVEVTALSPVYRDRECYRLRFDDGAEIVADAQHLWSTTHFMNFHAPYVKRSGRDDIRETSVVTTAEIAATLKTCLGTNNHFIPVSAPYDGDERVFDIDPYVLGVWLGDGDSFHGSITAHKDDAEEVAANLRACGEVVHVRPYADGSDRGHVVITKDHTRCPTGHVRPLGRSCVECARLAYHGVGPNRVNVSFAARLEAQDLRRNKHIPETYFAGSLKQRLALLQGIMDTDGSVNRKQGSAVLTLHDERLVRGVHRLVQSLGHKVNLRERTWTSKQLGTTGTCWRMSWSAIDPVFRMGRKLALQRTEFLDGGDGKSSSPFRRYIVACEPVDSVPVRCLTVDSESHLFCVTDAHIATHNSAEALAAAKASQMNKVYEVSKDAGRSHVQLLKLGCSYVPELEEYVQDVTGRVTWQDTSIRSLAAAVDALGKAATMLQVPVEVLWSRIPGVEKTDVLEWIELAKQKAEEMRQNDPLGRLSDTLDRQAVPATNGTAPKSTQPTYQ